jgi:hypothetical protein
LFDAMNSEMIGPANAAPPNDIPTHSNHAAQPRRRETSIGFKESE